MMSFGSALIVWAIFALIITALTAYLYRRTENKGTVLLLVPLFLIMPVMLYNYTYTTYPGWVSQNNLFISNTGMITISYLNDSGYHTHTLLEFSNAYTISNQRLYNIDFAAHSITINNIKMKIITVGGEHLILVDNYTKFSIDGETFTQGNVTVHPTPTDVLIQTTAIAMISIVIGLFVMAALDCLAIDNRRDHSINK